MPKRIKENSALLVCFVAPFSELQKTVQLHVTQTHACTHNGALLIGETVGLWPNQRLSPGTKRNFIRKLDSISSYSKKV